MRFLMLLLVSIPAMAWARPSGVVKFRNEICICRDRAAISFGPTCAVYCKGKSTDGAEILYASFSIAENGRFKTPREWCEKPQIFDFKKPKCVMSFIDSSRRELQLDVSFTGDNTISADVTNVDYDLTQITTLIETVSGARSDSSQVVKFDNTQGLPLLSGNLKRFKCLSRSQKSEFNFYFDPKKPVTPRPLSSDFICHDQNKFGERDDAQFPRLGETKAFPLWAGTSPLFFDNDANGKIDVYDVLRRKLQRFGGNPAQVPQIFWKLKFPGRPELYEAAGAHQDSSNWVMSYFVDGITDFSYCPDTARMDTMVPIMQALKSILGLPTEGLYAGVRTDDHADVVLLSESEIKAVWFYLRDGVPKLPADATMFRYEIYFHYPLDTLDPYSRKPYQKLYVVKSAQELGIPSLTVFPSHDRKIGCIPKR